MGSKKGKIITLSSFKGGTGKTITLLNLAGVFEKLNKKVLLVDLNFESGDLSIVLNTKMDKNIFNIVDDLSNNRFKDYKEYVTNVTENIDVVNSLKDPRQATNIDLRYIEIFLNHVSYKYDIILIDTTHGFSSVTVTAMDVSDENIILITNDIMDIKSTKTAISIMKDAKKDNYYIILNESVKLDNNYFTKFDIENIIKNNISFVIPKKYHVKNITSYILDGKILTLNKKIDMKDKVYFEIANKLTLEKR